LSTTFDVGPFADASLPHSDRILAAQTLVLAAALLALVLAALFSERRQNESALKKSNEKLKDSNDRLRLALDGAKLGAFSLDIATGHLDCDARTAQIHGHNTPPTTIKEGRHYVHPDDRARLDASFARAERTGGVWKAEYRIVPPPNHSRAGESLWVAFEGSVLYNAQHTPVRMLGITRDITERKLAEEAVRTSEERLRRVSDNADVGLIRCSRDWLYLSANPAYAKIAGKPLDQIMGRPMVEVMGAEAVETIRPYVERVLRGEHVIYEAEVPYAGAGNRYMHVSYTPDTDAAGQIVGWVACVTDITERKHSAAAGPHR
jgi:PAS domain S-box-containing protein